MTDKISITFPDGAVRSYKKSITGIEVANSISPSLGKKVIACMVGKKVSDLSEPIESDCSLRLLTYSDSSIALELIRHDCAHIMARAVQELWPNTKVAIGPVIENGFYYDFEREEAFTLSDLEIIEEKMRQIIALKDQVKFEVWDRNRVIEYYKKSGENYKVELAHSIPEGEDIKIYWHGYWSDLCRGPHLLNTGQVPAKAFKLTGVSGAYWRGDHNNPMLQRIYGTAWLSEEDLNKYILKLEEIGKRDHRKIGRDLGLFHIQDEALGMVFWHAPGWSIWIEIESYMRRKLNKSAYQEVRTPQLVDRILWEKSGHWEKFKESMFLAEVNDSDANSKIQKKISALKPMNCPCHVQIFNKGVKSYRNLPLRMSEFGACHRYEPSGAMHGILRVRGFTQDDAHIFCTEEQIESETGEFISLLSEVYRDFGFSSFKIKFSDRPEIRSGSDESWDKAEKSLLGAIETLGYPFELNPGEGAFYGPKLEFVLEDALGRDWQCGTLQVDSIVPERLGAKYVDENGESCTPIMLHRAILGSFERFIGILIEHYAGRLPLWLAPRQVAIATVVSDANSYAEKMAIILESSGIRVARYLKNEKISAKIREAYVNKIPVTIVIGRKEMEDGTIVVQFVNQEKEDTKHVLTPEDAVDMLCEACKPPDLI